MRGMWTRVRKGAGRFVETMAYADTVGLYGWDVAALRAGQPAAREPGRAGNQAREAAG